jgi:hypothetical protein
MGATAVQGVPARGARWCELDGLFEEIAEYDSLLRQHCGVTLAEAVVFEIGFGARPIASLRCRASESMCTASTPRRRSYADDRRSS